MASYPNHSKGEGLRRTYDLLEHLMDDVYKSFEVLDNDTESQFLRRNVVRTVFSFIEGVTQIVKYEVRKDFEREKTDIILTNKEKEIIFETKERNGEIINIRLATDDNIKKRSK